MTEQEIYAKCLGLGMTPAGAAGCTANIMAESAGRPNNVEDRSGIDDERYTQSVDNGSYTGFCDDRYGYGLVQLTLPSRKRAYIDYAKGHGKSIGDADTQLQFMAREMRSEYPFVWNTLTRTDSPYDAGYVMCEKYEIPANTTQQAQLRGNQAIAIYNRCSGTAPAKDPVDPTETPTEKNWPPRMLCVNMSGPDVTALQALLVAHGYGVTAVNGVFSTSTDKAVRQFQADRHLAVDGIAGNDTWRALLAFNGIRR